MEPHQRRALGGLLPDDQRDMLAGVVGAAEHHDFGVLDRGDRQARAGGHGQRRGIEECGEVAALFAAERLA